MVMKQLSAHTGEDLIKEEVGGEVNLAFINQAQHNRIGSLSE